MVGFVVEGEGECVGGLCRAEHPASIGLFFSQSDFEPVDEFLGHEHAHDQGVHAQLEAANFAVLLKEAVDVASPVVLGGESLKDHLEEAIHRLLNGLLVDFRIFFEQRVE